MTKQSALWVERTALWVNTGKPSRSCAFDHFFLFGGLANKLNISLNLTLERGVHHHWTWKNSVKVLIEIGSTQDH